MKKKAFTFENTYVNKLDLVRMAADLQENVGQPISIKSFGGLILKPKIGLLDTEIVLRPVPDIGEFEIDIYPADKKNEDGSTSMSIFPKWRVSLTVGELESYVLEAMPISEYVKGRRGYNSRLKQNEISVTDWLNEPA